MYFLQHKILYGFVENYVNNCNAYFSAKISNVAVFYFVHSVFYKLKKTTKFIFFLDF